MDIVVVTLVVVTLISANGLLVDTAHVGGLVDNSIAAGESRRCIFDETCLHGKCNIQTHLCECFTGWTGSLCETNAEEVTNTADVPKLTLSSIVDPSQGIVNETLTPRKRNACSQEYIPHLLTNRMCLLSLICNYGTCSRELHDTHLEFQCYCDDGAVGLFCEHKCCLDCGKNGQCVIFSDGQEYCNCKKGYSGERCKHPPANKLSEYTDSELSVADDSQVVPVIVITVLCFILLITVITCVALVKHKNITILEWMRFFQKCEDDGCYKYDVLVWYHKDTDSKHVAADDLLSYLQKKCLYTCTTTGIQDGNDEKVLKETIQSSRRVLLCLTKDLALHLTGQEITLLQQASELSNKLVLINCCNNDTDDKVMGHFNDAIQDIGLYLQYPHTCKNNEVINFYRRLSLLLPKESNVITKKQSTDNDVV